MQPDDLKFPVVFLNGVASFLERTDNWSCCWFGGPSEVQVHGMPDASVPPHHILTLGCREFPVLGKFGLHLSLFYGIRYSGCDMVCRKRDTFNLEISRMSPAPAEPDWPYPHYPHHLPYFPLRVARKLECDFETFSGLSCQPGWDVSPAAMVVIVPASQVIGMSLWGPSGDAERTQIIFECDLSQGAYRAFNQCA